LELITKQGDAIVVATKMAPYEIDEVTLYPSDNAIILLAFENIKDGRKPEFFDFSDAELRHILLGMKP
jgi:hypothetical protein